jgi:pyruvate kinase
MSPKTYYRKTKIICTIGPASEKRDILSNMIVAGMNVARLNMSHGDHDSHLRSIKVIKSINRTAPMPIALLLDTQGPEIRTGDINENFYMNVGDVYDITVSGSEQIEQNSTITVNYQDMIKDVKRGHRITVDNGLINLEVIKKSNFGLTCKVVDGGLMKSRRHVNLPGIRVNLPAITEKDTRDIKFAVQQDFDFIALSFVRSADDVEQCKKLIQKYNGHAQVIAKIEDKFGSENYKEIIKASHGVMVARGDLGVEVPIEELPIIQRRIIKECAAQGKRCIIATHLLESMIVNPMPTRAEVTDVANAAYEQCDAVMLSGESSVGAYPIKAVEYLDKITRRVELSGGIGYARKSSTIPLTHKEQMARRAAELADSIQADGIVVLTRRGHSAEALASFHPQYSPVFAFTNMTNVRRKLQLNRAIYPFRINFSNNPEKTINKAIDMLHEKKYISKKSTLVILSDVLSGDKMVETIQIRNAGDYIE